MATLYTRIQEGTLPARQEPAGRRRWMLRPSDVAALESKYGRGPEAGEWPHDLVALLVEQNRELETAHRELRDLERQAARHTPSSAGRRHSLLSADDVAALKQGITSEKWAFVTMAIRVAPSAQWR